MRPARRAEALLEATVGMAPGPDQLDRPRAPGTFARRFAPAARQRYRCAAGSACSGSSPPRSAARSARSARRRTGSLPRFARRRSSTTLSRDRSARSRPSEGVDAAGLSRGRVPSAGAGSGRPARGRPSAARPCRARPGRRAAAARPAARSRRLADRLDAEGRGAPGGDQTAGQLEPLADPWVQIGVVQEHGTERSERRGGLPAADLVVIHLGNLGAERRRFRVLVDLRLPAVGDRGRQAGPCDLRDRAVQPAGQRLGE